MQGLPEAFDFKLATLAQIHAATNSPPTMVAAAAAFASASITATHELNAKHHQVVVGESNFETLVTITTTTKTAKWHE